MAIFHLSHSFVRRCKGSSSIATAAYNSGSKLVDQEGNTGISDFSRKGGVLHSEIAVPPETPEWAKNRGELWRRLEAREDQSTRRASAILSHNINVALPCELTLEQNIWLVRDWVRENFARKGLIADWSIHEADIRGDDRNIHAHILVPLRYVEGDSFGQKERYTRNILRQQVIGWRASWSHIVNKSLCRYGHDERIDHRSLKSQGVFRLPTRHRGPRPKMNRTMMRSCFPAFPTPTPFMGMRSTPFGIEEDHLASRQRQTIGNREPVPEVRESRPDIEPVASTDRIKWPPEAIEDWHLWGKKAPSKFFTKWPNLMPKDFVLRPLDITAKS